MCDTMVALGNSTADGSIIFAKNSDREPNEAQGLVYSPAASHPADATVRCTFMEIPQARQTLAVILSKPFWMFGCEMGANEAGVVIGNEAVFTREPCEKTGLTGMDLVRLSLERADSAQAAVRTIVELISTYGQCASGGYQHTLLYHNSFIVADANEAYVLETANRYWAVERVRDIRSISNGLTIGSEWDDASPDLVDHALERRWCKSREDFNFARCYREPIYTYFSASAARRECTTRRLREHAGAISPQLMAGVLRDHGTSRDRAEWSPDRGIFVNVCAHAAPGPIRGGSQTAGSMIARIAGDDITCWMTGTAASCTSIFKPVWFDAATELPGRFGSEPGAAFDPAARWWRHERLHRATLQDYASRMSLYRSERDRLEAEFFAGALSASDREGYMIDCFRRSDEAEEIWTQRVQTEPIQRRPGVLYRRFWIRQNRRAQM